jgi:uncharacterized protein with FMN-binding domain
MQRNPLRPVQVPATAKGLKIVTGRGEARAPKNGRYAQSNALVLAILDREVVPQQSAVIDALSGATMSSDGYLQSLQWATDQAHL